MFLRGRDPRREWEQQAAFEEAERLRAEKRAGAVFESFIDSTPVGIEVFGVDGRLLKSNKAAERLLGKVPPPGLSLFEERGLKRAGLLEPQLKRVLAGTRVETPPTWYDPTEIGLPGIPGRKMCFRATVFPLFDAEGKVMRIAVIHEDITEFKQLEAGLKQANRQTEAPARPAGAPAPGSGTDIATSLDIRELEFRRRKVEQALREAEERHRAFVEGQQGYIALELTEDGRFLSVSPSVESVWGVSAATIQADPSSFYAQVHPDDRELVKDTEAGIRRSDAYPEQYRFRVRNKKTDATHWVEVRGSVSKVAGRKNFHAIAIDISHLVSVEQTLRRKTAALEILLSTSHDGLVQLDSGLKIVRWSRGAEKETHLSAGDTTGRLISEVYPGLSSTGFLAVLQESLAKTVSLRHEAFYNDGREQYAGWYEITTYPWDSGLLLLIRNTTRLKTAEQALAGKQADLESLANSQVEGIIILDRNLVVTQWNQAAEKETRISSREALGRPITEVYPEFAGTGFLAPVKESLARRTSLRHEGFYTDGRERQTGWFSIASYPFGSGVLLIVRNITQLKKAEQAWLLADSRLKALLGLPGLAVATKDRELRYTMANPETMRMLGLAAESAILGRTDQEILKPVVADLLASHDRKVLSDGKPVELELVLPDGLSPKAAWYRLTKSALRAAGNDVVGVLTVATDITRRIHVQQELGRRREFLARLLESQTTALDQVEKELRRWSEP